MSRIIDDIILGDDASFASVLVDSKKMTLDEIISEAIRRSKEEALNLEAAVEAARTEG